MTRLFFPALLAMIIAACSASPGQVSDAQSPLTVTAMINESIMPVARGEKYGQLLDAYLSSLNIGEVIGAGTALTPSGGPEWVEIVVELRQGEQSLAGVAQKLKELGAPKGGHLYYYVGDERRQLPIE